MAIHVSIHDVSPAWEREVEGALELTHAVGVRPALLVVPNFHGRAKLTDHSAYCDRLRALEAEGHEVYLHGYFHRARVEAAADDGIGDRLRRAVAQKLVSGGEAELMDVSRGEALTRLDDGERMLRDIGLTIRGFVAPAWSMPSWVLPLLAERGYAFTEDHTRVYDPAAGRSRASLVLNFASRSPARLFTSAAWCRVARPFRRLVPTRIAIHPADMRVAMLRSEVASLLAWGARAGDYVETGRALLD